MNSVTRTQGKRGSHYAVCKFSVIPCSVWTYNNQVRLFGKTFVKEKQPRLKRSLAVCDSILHLCSAVYSEDKHNIIIPWSEAVLLYLHSFTCGNFLIAHIRSCFTLFYDLSTLHSQKYNDFQQESFMAFAKARHSRFISLFPGRRNASFKEFT